MNGPELGYQYVPLSALVPLPFSSKFTVTIHHPSDVAPTPWNTALADAPISVISPPNGIFLRILSQQKRSSRFAMPFRSRARITR
jgi:hypothetical protein